MINAIYPSLMCVLISISAFWIREEDPTRLIIGVMSFLSIKTIGYTFNQGIPPVGYPKVLLIIRDDAQLIICPHRPLMYGWFGVIFWFS